MAPSPRLFLRNAIYHVYCRTARGEMVFTDEVEAESFIQSVGGVKRPQRVTVARRRYSLKAFDDFGYSVAEVAGFLGKHPGTVSRWIGTSISPPRRATDIPGGFP